MVDALSSGGSECMLVGVQLPPLARREKPRSVGIPTFRGFLICAKYWNLIIAGAVCFALRKPNPVPGWFEFHEVFHLGTVIGYACHVVAIYLIACAL